MCVLHVSSKTDSLRGIVNNSKMPVNQSHEKGDKKTPAKNSPLFEDFSFSCKVSDKEWDDLPGQIEDTIAFLTKHEEELTGLLSSHGIDCIWLDYPYYCRHSRTIIYQCDFLPPKLLLQAGKLNIGIKLSLYPKPKKGLLDKFIKNSGLLQKP